MDEIETLIINSQQEITRIEQIISASESNYQRCINDMQEYANVLRQELIESIEKFTTA